MEININTLKLVCFVISVTSLIWYGIYCMVTLKKISTTWSDTYYDLPKKKRKYFTFFTLGVSLPLLAFCYDPLAWIFIPAILMMAMVGGFAMFREKWIGIYHVIFAIGCGVVAMLGFIIHFHNWTPLILFVAITGPAAIFSKKKWIGLIMETTAFITVLIGFSELLNT